MFKNYDKNTNWLNEYEEFFAFALCFYFKRLLFFGLKFHKWTLTHHISFFFCTSFRFHLINHRVHSQSLNACAHARCLISRTKIKQKHKAKNCLRRQFIIYILILTDSINVQIKSGFIRNDLTNYFWMKQGNGDINRKFPVKTFCTNRKKKIKQIIATFDSYYYFI